jgi:SP family general alpha glucoside:H+ symporter-like MFS transporter
MSGLAEPKHNATHVDAVGDDIREKDYHHQAEVLDDKELMTDAQNAETRDHGKRLIYELHVRHTLTSYTII